MYVHMYNYFAYTKKNMCVCKWNDSSRKRHFIRIKGVLRVEIVFFLLWRTMQQDFPKTNKGLGQTYNLTDLDRSRNCVIERKRGFRPSDCYDESKKQILLELSRKLWKKQNVRRPFWIDWDKISTLHINAR